MPGTVSNLGKAMLPPHAPVVFPKWQRTSGVAMPAEVVDFDTRIIRWVECTYSGGESQTLLADTLSGLSHLVPVLRGQLNASWRRL